MPKEKVKIHSTHVSNLMEEPEKPIGQMLHYRAMGGDSAIVVSKTSISLFVHDKFVKNLIKFGRGANEYRDLSAIQIYQDTLYILSSPDKILCYSFQKDSIVKTYQFKDIYTARSFARLPNGKFLFTSVFFPDDDQKKEDQQPMVFFAENSNKQPEYLSLKQGDLQFSRRKIPMISPVNDLITTYQNYVIIRYPLTPYVVLYHWKDEIISLLQIQIRIKYFDHPSESNDDKIMSESDFLSKVFPLQDKIAVMLLKHNRSTSQAKPTIQFYSYTGASIGEIEFDATQLGMMPVVVDVDEKQMTILALNNDINAKNPYKLIRYLYEIIP